MRFPVNLDVENYIYQDCGDGEIIIFVSDEKVTELQQFKLAAHYDTYDRVKTFLSTSSSMEGTDWNENYKVFESLTFYDSTGESTTIPINAAKLGANTKLEKEDLAIILKFINELEEEEKNSKDTPLPPMTLNIIDSNGVSQTVVAQCMHGAGEPTHNGRVYSPEVLQRAFEKFDATNPPNLDGAPISDAMNSGMKPSFSIRAEGTHPVQ